MINDGAAQWKVMDVKLDAEEISSVKSRMDSAERTITELETATREENNFTIIYPNGGTEQNPATITTGKRLIENNPFPGYHVLCIAQLKYENDWGETNWAYAGGNGFGTKTGHLTESDKIIIQTGNSAIAPDARSGGSILGNTQNIISAPIRVLVYKLGKKE